MKSGNKANGVEIMKLSRPLKDGAARPGNYNSMIQEVERSQVAELRNIAWLYVRCPEDEHEKQVRGGEDLEGVKTGCNGHTQAYAREAAVFERNATTQRREVSTKF